MLEITGPISQIMARFGLHEGTGRELAISTSINFLIKILWKLIGLISTIVLARLLGAEGLGTYAFALTIVGFVSTFGPASMNSLIVQKLSGYVGLQKWSLARGLQRRSRELAFICAAFLAICTGFIAWYFIDPSADELRPTLIIAAILFPIASQIHLTSAVLHGVGHVILAQIPEWILRPLVFLVLLLTIYLIPEIQLSAPVAMIAQVLAAAAALLFGFLLVWPRIPSAMKTAAPIYETRAWLRGTFPFLAIGMLNRVNVAASLLLLGVVADMEAVGIFRPAASIALMITFGSDAVGLTIRHTVADRYATGRTGGFQRLSAYSAWVGFGIAFLGAGVALLFGDFLLLVFGPEFPAGTIALGILCVGRLLSAGLGQPAVFLAMTGRQHIIMWGAIWAASANILLNLILIPQLDVNGAAIATTTSLLILKIHNMIAVRRQLQINTTIFTRQVLPKGII